MLEALLVHGLEGCADDGPVLDEVKVIESILLIRPGLLHLQHHRQPAPLVIRIIG